jgi:hypothetical protein
MNLKVFLMLMKQVCFDVLSSKTAIDNIFVDSTRLSSSCSYIVVSRLSDHGVQFLTVNNITTKVNLIPLKQRTRKINNETTAQFQHLLENEMRNLCSKIMVKAITPFSYVILSVFEASFLFTINV